MTTLTDEAFRRVITAQALQTQYDSIVERLYERWFDLKSEERLQQIESAQQKLDEVVEALTPIRKFVEKRYEGALTWRSQTLPLLAQARKLA